MGDTRWAMAPFLAFKTMQARNLANVRWLFLGDDDTLFMVDAAREVTRGLDHNMPIFLTGDVQDGKKLCTLLLKSSVPLPQTLSQGSPAIWLQLQFQALWLATVHETMHQSFSGATFASHVWCLNLSCILCLEDRIACGVGLIAPI